MGLTGNCRGDIIQLHEVIIMKAWYESKTVWGIILGLIAYWAQAMGLSLDSIMVHLQDAWNSIAAILVVLGLRQADKPLSSPFRKPDGE